MSPYQDKAALLSLYNELYNEIARLEWRVSPELLRLSTLPHWANLTILTVCSLTHQSDLPQLPGNAFVQV